jgi:Sulfite exporter TauE/SafE
MSRPQPEPAEIGKQRRAPTRGRPLLAFGFAILIATLGGLIGLGGAEFRLPVLAGPLGYPARRAVPLNLAVSLVTLGTARLTRGRSLSLDPVAPFLPAVLAMTAGAVFAAFVGSAPVGRLSNERLERVILVLLVTIGAALIIEGFLSVWERLHVARQGVPSTDYTRDDGDWLRHVVSLNCDGVSPKARRKTAEKWLWLEKPTLSASVVRSSVWGSSASARARRSCVR